MALWTAGKLNWVLGEVVKVVKVAAVNPYTLRLKEKLQIMRALSGLSALHGAVRPAFCSAAWCSKMPLANTGAVLGAR